MKLVELFYAVGIRPRTRQYPFELTTFRLERDGDVGFAQWQHPGALRWKTSFSQAMVDEARRYIEPGDVVIDVGAHAGDSTLPLALAAGPTGAVFALEPNPHVFKVLLATTALNRRTTNIYPLMFAATDDDCAFEFQYSDPGFCNGGMFDDVDAMRHAHFFKLPVQGRNLARYLDAEFPAEAQRIRFIKVDTEGYDRTVIASLQPLIARSRPFIRAEIYRHSPADERRRFWRDLHEAGYAVSRYGSDESYLGDPLTEDDMSRWSHFDIFAVPA